MGRFVLPFLMRGERVDFCEQVSKTVADKLLKEMEQNGVIMGKATKKDGGGQWVFWAIQVCFLLPTPLVKLIEGM